MQKIMSVVIGVYKFGQEFFIIGIFWNILYKYQKKLQLNLHEMHLCSMQKIYMQPAQIKLHPAENFLHPAKILPPYFAG